MLPWWMMPDKWVINRSFSSTWVMNMINRSLSKVEIGREFLGSWTVTHHFMVVIHAGGKYGIPWVCPEKSWATSWGISQQEKLEPNYATWLLPTAVYSSLIVTEAIPATWESSNVTWSPSNMKPTQWAPWFHGIYTKPGRRMADLFRARA